MVAANKAPMLEKMFVEQRKTMVEVLKFFGTFAF